MTQECVVIGRGLAGLSLARELQKNGFKVTVVGPAAAEDDASRSAQGVSSVKGLLYGRGDLFRAKLEGHRYLRGWIEEVSRESDVPIPFSFMGAWEPVDGEENYQNIQNRVYKLSWTGAYGVAAQSFPHKIFKTANGARFAHALRHPYDGWVDVPRLLDALEAIILKNGGEIYSATVRRLEPLRAKGWSVIIDGQALQADEVFLAAGWGANGLAEGLGLRFAVKKVPGATLQWRGLWADHGAYLFGKRSFVAGYQGSWKFGSIDTKVEPRSSAEQSMLISSLKLECTQHLECDPQLLDTATLHWGTRICARDLLPIVGSLSLDSGHRLFVSCAFHKSGLQLAPLSAKKIVNALQGEILPPHWRAFDPNRKGLARSISRDNQ